MRRLNVQFSQIEECIRTSLFAVDALPQHPALERGEPLLLQLTKADAARLGKDRARIEFALIFDHFVPDPTGELSRQHWPRAAKTWRYILVCSETIPTLPFSLDSLSLSRDYAGQTNPQYIEPQDAARITSYLKGGVSPAKLPELVSVHGLLAGLRNYDLVRHLSPRRTSVVQEHERVLSDPWLGDTLKVLYEHRCQICLHDFKPRYGIPYANTRFLVPLKAGGEAVSKNIVVLCPNHDAIIGTSNARFDGDALAFQFANGLVEKLMLRDHLVV